MLGLAHWGCLPQRAKQEKRRRIAVLRHEWHCRATSPRVRREGRVNSSPPFDAAIVDLTSSTKPPVEQRRSQGSQANGVYT